MRETLSAADERLAAPPQEQRRWTRLAALAALAAGDAVSFVVFATVGRHSHHEASGLGAVKSTLATALPFAMGWFAVSPFLGAFRRSKTTGVRAMVARTELAWLCAWPVAVFLRWALAPDHKMPLSFALVILIANAVFLGVWRCLYELVAGRRG